jgi:hypothetical protein
MGDFSDDFITSIEYMSDTEGKTETLPLEKSYPKVEGEQTGGEINQDDLQKFEQDIREIYERARNYRDNLEKLQRGGDLESAQEKPIKRRISPGFKLIIDMTKVLRDHVQGQNVSQAILVKVASNIRNDISAKMSIDKNDVAQIWKKFQEMVQNGQINRYLEPGYLGSIAAARSHYRHKRRSRK